MGVQPDTVYLGSADFMVLSGKMTFGSGPLAGVVDPGTFGYIPGGAFVESVKADEDCEYLMNFHGAAAFLKDGKTVGLFTGADVAAAAKSRGITLVPSTLGDCLDHAEKNNGKAYEGVPLAISGAEAAALGGGAEGVAQEANVKMHPHFVDTK